MTKEELFTLLKAGFTKEEVLQLNASKEFLTEEQSRNEEAPEENTSESNPVTDGVSDEAFSKLNQAIEGFTKKLESFNVMNAEMNVENKGDEKLEDILARVLLPDGKEIK